MSIKPILTVPNPILLRKSLPVDLINEDITDLIDNLLDTMNQFKAAGLAAVQLGVLKRVFVVNTAVLFPEDIRWATPSIFINPIVHEFDSVQVPDEEGCLSIPDKTFNVMRPKKVRITARHPDNELFTIIASDMYARVIFHENDHLNGVLINKK